MIASYKLIILTT